MLTERTAAKWLKIGGVIDKRPPFLCFFRRAEMTPHKGRDDWGSDGLVLVSKSFGCLWRHLFFGTALVMKIESRRFFAGLCVCGKWPSTVIAVV